MTYMGHTLLTENYVPFITPFEDNVGCYYEVEITVNAERLLKVSGMVYYLGIILKDRIGPFQFITWQDEVCITYPSVLVMSNGTGRLPLTPDTSKILNDAALYHEQKVN